MTPTISVVTPCRNQVAVVDATIRSVLDAHDPPDEYVVVDGASTDGTADAIARHAERLTWWTSEPDDGQYAAIQKGFERTTGDVMAWINGGDLFMPWTVSVVRELFAQFPQVEWLTTLRPLIVDDRGRVVSCEFIGGFSARSFRAGVNLPGGQWFARAGIQQESTFWRRSLWDRAGAMLDAGLQYAGDFELWLRFFDHAEPYAVDAPLGAHRVHQDQKTSVLDSYIEEAVLTLRTRGLSAHGHMRSAALRTAYHILGRRPLRRLPWLLVAPLRRVGILNRVQTIVWRDGNWHIVGDFVV